MLSGNLVSPPLEPLPSDEWSKRNPLDFPEMTLPPLKEEEGFGANLHDRDTAPSLSPEKMKLFHDQLAEGGSSDQRDESHAAKNLTSKYAVRLVSDIFFLDLLSHFSVSLPLSV